jgi:hypothetical protein
LHLWLNFREITSTSEPHAAIPAGLVVEGRPDGPKCRCGLPRQQCFVRHRQGQRKDNDGDTFDAGGNTSRHLHISCRRGFPRRKERRRGWGHISTVATVFAHTMTAVVPHAFNSEQRHLFRHLFRRGQLVVIESWCG